MTHAEYAKALQRAHDEGIQIVGSSASDDGRRAWSVWNPTHGEQGWYTVRQAHRDAPLTCNCAARGYCKHHALVQEAITQATQEQRRDNAHTVRDAYAGRPTDTAAFSLWK
jgi:hypothetical protein